MRAPASHSDPGLTQRVHGTKKDASFQVIILGASGGPREDTITGLLVRAPQSEWRKGSMIAVDAGTHLASIIRILQQYMPLHSKEMPPKGYSRLLEQGPFAGIKFPGYSAKANGLFVFRELMHAFLITHPHLDHLSAMGINTPALEYGREAKTIVALDSTIEAIKAHIFNDWIWPNLSDEGSGVGFVTYRRLREGGNARLGSGDARGYVRVCDSLATLCMGVTHGKCKPRIPNYSHQRSESSGLHDGYVFPQRRLSRMSDHESYFAAIAHQHGHHHPAPAAPAWMHPPPGQTTPGFSTAPTPTMAPLDLDHQFEAVKSSAFFILNEETASEILIFGDIEPDSVSMSPLNYKVWKAAAPKVANGNLKAIFIECSYDDNVRDADLYGHLCPRHLIHELYFLASEVVQYREAKQNGLERLPSPVLETKRPAEPNLQLDLKKRRKKLNGEPATPIAEAVEPISAVPTELTTYVGKRSSSAASRRAPFHPTPASTLPESSPISSRTPKHVQFDGSAQLPPPLSSPTHHPGVTPSPFQQPQLPPPPIITAGIAPPPNPDVTALKKLSEPLKGLTVHIIHVKDTLSDGPSPGEIIAKQLQTRASDAGLGCDFDVTEAGESIWV